MQAYDALVAARKTCRICVERNPGKIRSCAEFDYDPDVVSHWELWLGHKAPKLVVVGQDFGNVGYFTRNRGRDDPANKTNGSLWKLLGEAGIRVRHPREPDTDAPVFLTNSVLCLKEGPMNAPVRASWVGACSRTHLRPLLDFLDPPVVVGMGRWGWQAVRLALALGHAPQPIAAAAGSCWLGQGRRVFAVGHCSPLGLINRPWRQQIADWRRIGEAVATAARPSDATQSSLSASNGSHSGMASSIRVGSPISS
jgi:uracil-DNA glycosylase